jgi:dienelactone hydrolase
MIRDAFAALAYLAKHPMVEPAQIAVMGMSKGGAVALQAADPREQAAVRKQLGVGVFAAHVPLYPGCNTQYRNPRMTAPMLVLIGEDDDYTGVKSCAEYVERIRASGGKIELKTYRGASHGFDGDTSTQRNFWIPTAQNFRDCAFFIEDDGRIVSRAGTVLDPINISTNIQIARRECMRLGATVGGNSTAKSQALADITAFLKGNLRPGGDQK